MIKKTKQTTGELIIGINPLIELLKAKRRKIISLYTTKPQPKRWRDIEKVLPKYPVAIQYVTREVLNRMANTTEHQSIVAWVESFPFRKKPFDPSKQPFILLLDGIQDPHNLGAIIRSAYCTGVDGVVITQKHSAPLNAVALKASAGLAEHVEIIQAPSALAAAQDLKKAGYNLYCAAFGGQDATTVAYKKPTCLVIGSEGIGITKSVISLGTEVTLPQRDTDVSYNASVAAGILLFVIGGQHKPGA